MTQRGSYHTRQKDLLLTCLSEHPDRYLTVREIEALLADGGGRVSSTTLYRNLERMVAAGEVAKFIGAGGEARYRRIGEKTMGQLVCLDCGGVEVLECDMLEAFSEHVRLDHGFSMEASRSMLFGHCMSCQNAGAAS